MKKNEKKSILQFNFFFSLLLFFGWSFGFAFPLALHFKGDL